jgi:hypothetical protein
MWAAMGTTCNSLHIFVGESQFDSQTIAQLVDETAVLTQPSNGWVSLYGDAGWGMGSDFPMEFSMALGLPVLSVWCHDSDAGGASLWVEGVEAGNISLGFPEMMMGSEYDQILLLSGSDQSPEEMAESMGVSVESLLFVDATLTVPLFPAVESEFLVCGNVRGFVDLFGESSSAAFEAAFATHPGSPFAEQLLASLISTLGIDPPRSLSALRFIENGETDGLGTLTWIGR